MTGPLCGCASHWQTSRSPSVGTVHLVLTNVSRDAAAGFMPRKSWICGGVRPGAQNGPWFMLCSSCYAGIRAPQARRVNAADGASRAERLPNRNRLYQIVHRFFDGLIDRLPEGVG